MCLDNCKFSFCSNCFVCYICIALGDAGHLEIGPPPDDEEIDVVTVESDPLGRASLSSSHISSQVWMIRNNDSGRITLISKIGTKSVTTTVFFFEIQLKKSEL